MSAIEIDGEIVEEHLPAVRESAASPTLFGTDDPAAVIAKATAAAKPLAEVVRAQRLAVGINGREHVKVEGWTLLGSMLGVFPICVWSRKLEDGWEARVEARTRDGALVGAAEAECLRSESKWKSRDDYALRSMAQTRATSKALRQPLGFVMQLAGFDATPAEEMPTDAGQFRQPDNVPAPDQPKIGSPGSVVLTFGKHSGKPIRDVPRQYLDWWVGQPAPNTDELRTQRAAAELFLQGVEDASLADESDIPFAHIEPSEPGVHFDPWRR